MLLELHLKAECSIIQYGVFITLLWKWYFAPQMILFCYFFGGYRGEWSKHSRDMIAKNMASTIAYYPQTKMTWMLQTSSSFTMHSSVGTQIPWGMEWEIVDRLLHVLCVNIVAGWVSGEKTTRGESYLGSHQTPRNCRPSHTDNSVMRRVA